MEVYTFYPDRTIFKKPVMPITNIRLEIEENTSSLGVFIDLKNTDIHQSNLEKMMDWVYRFLLSTIGSIDGVEKLKYVRIYDGTSSDNNDINDEELDKFDKLQLSALLIVQSYIDSIAEFARDYVEYYYNEGYLDLISEDEIG